MKNVDQVNKVATSYRLSATALELLEKLAEVGGLSKASTIELLIRNEARRQNFTIKPTKKGAVKK